MKRFISAALSLVMLLGVPAGAAGEPVEETRAINAVKSIAKLGDEFSEHYSYTNKKTNGTKKVNTMSVSLFDAEGNDHVSAEVDENGNLLSFYRYHYSDSRVPKLGKIKKADAQKTAKEFIDKVYANSKLTAKEIENESDSFGDSFYFGYMLQYDGIPIMNTYSSVNVDKITGNVQSYDCYSNLLLDMPTFEAKGSVISENDAKKAMLANGEVQPYYSYMYSEDEDVQAILTYGYVDAKLDAKTGALDTSESANLYFYYDYEDDYDYNGMYYPGCYGGSWVSEASFEPEVYYEEGSEAMVTRGALITMAKAESAARNAFDITADKKLVYADLSKGWYDETYTWSISFDDCYVNVDAKTSSIISYSTYLDDEGGAPITQEQALEKAAALKNKLAPELADKLSEGEVFTNQDYNWGSNVLNVYYSRMENGIRCNYDGVSVEVNLNTGKIAHYYKSWENSVTFPSAEGNITPEQAMDALAKVNGFGLKYFPTNSGTAKLVYAFDDNGYEEIDAKTGKKVEYPEYNDSFTGEYTDIAGHWCEEKVNALKDNGYYLVGTEFRPDETITRRDFCRLLMQYWGGDENAYFDEYALSYGLTVKGEDMNAQLTRQEAAQILIRMMGLSQAADQSEVFKNMFNDVVAPEYLGYAALAKQFGIFKGDANGNFNGTATLSRAEAASVIYNFMTME